MPNWLEGVVKFRGKYNDIKKFLEEELIEFDMEIKQNKVQKININNLKVD